MQPQPTKSVEEICAAIQRHQLMSSKDFAAMRARWFRPDRKDVADPEHFRQWLVGNRYLTKFVARVVSGRKADQLVLNQYRLQDQLISGPMAGSYLAIDSLDRHVAIEVLAASSAADKAVLAGFQKAAQQAMEVHHPNVGRILDCGEAHRLHYLVKEYYEGQTLEDILQRRKKLPYEQATRLVALALAGLDALHAQGVEAGDLTADCLLLASAGKDSPNQRTVKILHAGIRRKMFDETAIGRSISFSAGIPDELELAASCTFQLAWAAEPNPTEDIFKLGCVFYRCVTGEAPYSEKQLPRPPQPARPVCEVAPEVPEMLGQIIDQMIDPDPSKRQQKAAHVAKALRVFLAAEGEAREVKAEDNIVSPTRPEPAPAAADEAEEEPEELEEVEEAPRRPARKRAHAEQEGAWGKVVALWEEVQPGIRDLAVFAGGALVMLLLIFLVHFLTGLGLPYIAGLATGVVASVFVDWFVRWRREHEAQAS